MIRYFLLLLFIPLSTVFTLAQEAEGSDILQLIKKHGLEEGQVMDYSQQCL